MYTVTVQLFHRPVSKWGRRDGGKEYHVPSHPPKNICQSLTQPTVWRKSILRDYNFSKKVVPLLPLLTTVKIPRLLPYFSSSIFPCKKLKLNVKATYIYHILTLNNHIWVHSWTENIIHTSGNILRLFYSHCFPFSISHFSSIWQTNYFALSETEFSDFFSDHST